MSFFIILLFAHLPAVLVPAWFAYRIKQKQINLSPIMPSGGISLLQLGFTCFSIAALAEMLDHTETGWIYINRLSLWNGLFYAGLSGGLAFLTAAVTDNKRLHTLLVIIVVAGIAGYLCFGKEITIVLQSIITLLFLTQWWKHFHDPLLWIYPVCGVVLTTIFGGLLSSTGDQIWHVFIGPAGSISLITLWIIMLRARKPKEPLLNKTTDR